MEPLSVFIQVLALTMLYMLLIHSNRSCDLPCMYHLVYADYFILYAEHLVYVEDPVHVDHLVMYQNLEVCNSDLLWNHTW